MSRDIKLYLDDILESIERIKQYAHGLDEKSLASDYKI